jgi:hypothetical protein
VKGGERFNDFNNSAVPVQIDQIEWDAHIRIGNPSEWRHPETLARLQRKLSQLLLEGCKRNICGSDLQAKKAFAGLVICAKSL